MHNVGHCTFVAAEDIARARAIGATFEVSPYLWSPSPISDDIAAAVGPEVIKRVWPVRELIESGALVVPGSDWSVVPSVNPWIGIETLVTRQVPGGGGRFFGKTEAISFAAGHGSFHGQCRTPGAHVQPCRLHRRLACSPTSSSSIRIRTPFLSRKIHDTKVRMTFIAGEKVYDASRER